MDEEEVKAMTQSIEGTNPYDIGQVYLEHKINREEHLKDFQNAVKVNPPYAGSKKFRPVSATDFSKMNKMDKLRVWQQAIK